MWVITLSFFFQCKINYFRVFSSTGFPCRNWWGSCWFGSSMILFTMLVYQQLISLTKFKVWMVTVKYGARKCVCRHLLLLILKYFNFMILLLQFLSTEVRRPWAWIASEVGLCLICSFLEDCSPLVNCIFFFI